MYYGQALVPNICSPVTSMFSFGERGGGGGG